MSPFHISGKQGSLGVQKVPGPSTIHPQWWTMWRDASNWLFLLLFLSVVFIPALWDPFPRKLHVVSGFVLVLLSHGSILILS